MLFEFSEMRSTKPVLLENAHGISRIILNRPDRLNVLDFDMADALADAVDMAAGDPDTRVIALVAAGKSFMGGGDLKLFADDFNRASESASCIIERLNRTVTAIRNAAVPVVCGVQGAVAGGGLSLALACDIIVSSDDARFVPAYLRIGATPDGGMTLSLVQAAGPRRTLSWLMLGEALDARGAIDLGIIDRLVKPSSVHKTVEEIAQRLANAPREALGRLKRLVYEAAHRTLAEQLNEELASFLTSTRSEEFKEGVQSFIERREPQF